MYSCEKSLFDAPPKIGIIHPSHPNVKSIFLCIWCLHMSFREREIQRQAQRRDNCTLILAFDFFMLLSGQAVGGNGFKREIQIGHLP